jgi:hypothetical protein
VSMVAGARFRCRFSLPFDCALSGKVDSRLLLHPCFGYEEISSGLLAAAQSSLICLEDLLSMSGPIISFLFPAHVPLVSAFIFVCSNLTLRIVSLLAPKQRIRGLSA